MKIAPDITSVIEDDALRLTEALISGEIALADGRGLSEMGLTEADMHRLAREVLNFMLDRRLLAPVIQYLSTMKWLTLQEAYIYTRRSRNTIIRWLEDGKIYGSKPEGSGDWLVDRESIDSYLYAVRDQRRIHLARRAS